MIYRAKRIRTISAAAALALMAGGLSSLKTEAAGQGNPFRGAADAPPSWMQFSNLIKFRFEEWVGGEGVEAKRFREWGTAKKGTAGGPPDSVLVKVWATPDGKVDKLLFPPLSDPQADQDLRAILTSGNLGEAPPPDMLQPINLRVSLLFTK